LLKYKKVNKKTMADPIVPSTTDKKIILTKEQVVELTNILKHIPDPSKEVVEIYDKVKLL
tara:strand:- start:633 stop:812 length:180 start_codon:yes stop_codon:yes gene_type:complete